MYIRSLAWAKWGWIFTVCDGCVRPVKRGAGRGRQRLAMVRASGFPISHCRPVQAAAAVGQQRKIVGQRVQHSCRTAGRIPRREAKAAWVWPVGADQPGNSGCRSPRCRSSWHWSRGSTAQPTPARTARYSAAMSSTTSRGRWGRRTISPWGPCRIHLCSSGVLPMPSVGSRHRSWGAVGGVDWSVSWARPPAGAGSLPGA